MPRKRAIVDSDHSQPSEENTSKKQKEQDNHLVNNDVYKTQITDRRYSIEDFKDDCKNENFRYPPNSYVVGATHIKTFNDGHKEAFIYSIPSPSTSEKTDHGVVYVYNVVTGARSNLPAR